MTDFFVTNWKSTQYRHFAKLSDAIAYARRLGVDAVVYGSKGEVRWLP